MIEEERIQALMNLGLTFLQAKIYLAIAHTEQATIKAIAKTASIARQDVYRVIPTLEKRGLAEKLLTAPTTYKAIPLREGCYLLLNNKTREHSELQKKTIALINNLREDKNNTIPQEEETQFIVTSSENLLFRRLSERDQTVQSSIDTIGAWKDVKSLLFNHSQEYKDAVERGVKIRMITEKHDEVKTLQKITKTLMMTPLFSIRYVPAPIPAKLAIFDKVEVNLCIASSQN